MSADTAMMNEKRGDLIAATSRAILTDLGIDPADEHVRQVCARRCREAAEAV